MVLPLQRRHDVHGVDECHVQDTGEADMVERVRAAVATQRVASYRSYAEIQRAVNVLAGHKFPLEHVAIGAADLAFVTAPWGRPGFTEAATRGAASGALTGLLVVLLLGWLGLTMALVSGLWVTLYGVLLGAIAGAVVGAAAHAAREGCRDVSSARRFDARRYDLLVSESFAAEARRALSRLRIARPA